MPGSDAKRIELLQWAFQSFPRFCGLLQIRTKAGAKVPFRLNTIQRSYLAGATDRDIIVKGRQVGMTTMLLARDVYRFLTVPGARVVVICQSMTGNVPIEIVAGPIRSYLEQVKALGVDVDMSTERGAEWALRKRDATLRIMVAGASDASAAKTGRAGTVTHLHCTEVAFWDRTEETWNAVQECVPEGMGSEVVLESTPNGAGGLFYDLFKSATTGTSSPYKGHFFPWFMHEEYRVPLDQDEVIEPMTTVEEELIRNGVRQDQLKWYRRKVATKGQALASQEYPNDPESCFLTSGRTFFDGSVTALLAEHVRPPIDVQLDGMIRIWERPKPGVQYIIAADPSEGVGGKPMGEVQINQASGLPEKHDGKRGGDPGAAVVYERATGKHVATLHAQLPPWVMGDILSQLGTFYNGALVVVERNNHGHAVLLALARDKKYPNIYIGLDKRAGWLTSEVSRITALERLEHAHREGHWSTPDTRVLAEVRTFLINPKTGKAEAAPGGHDDLVLATAIAWDVICKPLPRARDLQHLPPG